MTGSANTPAPVSPLTYSGQQVAEKVTGTGTSNDNAIIVRVQLGNPDTGALYDAAVPVPVSAVIAGLPLPTKLVDASSTAFGTQTNPIYAWIRNLTSATDVVATTMAYIQVMSLTGQVYTGGTTGWSTQTGWYDVSALHELYITAKISAITAGSGSGAGIALTVMRNSGYGDTVTLWTPSVLNSAVSFLSTSIGPGLQNNAGIGQQVRFGIQSVQGSSGTSPSSVTLSLDIGGK